MRNCLESQHQMLIIIESIARTGKLAAKWNSYGPMIQSWCASGDPVCCGTGVFPATAHLSYFTPEIATSVGNFVQARFAASGRKAANNSSASAAAAAPVRSTVLPSLSSAIISALTTTAASSTSTSTTSAHTATSAHATTSAPTTTLASVKTVLTSVSTAAAVLTTVAAQPTNAASLAFDRPSTSETLLQVLLACMAALHAWR